MLEYIILGFLYQNSLTGYDIKKCIDQGVGMFYRVSYGSLYPLLDRLRNKELVTCSSEIKGKRETKKYEITDKGQQVFMQWLTEEEYENSSIEAFMARVYFFDLLTEATAFAIIQRYEAKLKVYLQELLKKKEKYEEAGRQRYYYKVSTLYFGICKIQSILDWCSVTKQKEDLNTLMKVERED